MRHLILIFTILFSILSCERSPQDNEFRAILPPITENGSNTFGAKINGKVYIPKSSKNDISNIGYPIYNGVWEDFSYDENKTFSPLVNLDKVNLTRIFLRINDTKK